MKREGERTFVKSRLPGEEAFPQAVRRPASYSLPLHVRVAHFRSLDIVVPVHPALALSAALPTGPGT